MGDQDLDDVKLPFGKHRGQSLNEIPLRYLDWLIGQDWFEEKFPQLHREVMAYLKQPAIARELDRELEDE